MRGQRLRLSLVAKTKRRSSAARGRGKKRPRFVQSHGGLYAGSCENLHHDAILNLPVCRARKPCTHEVEATNREGSAFERTYRKCTHESASDS